MRISTLAAVILCLLGSARAAEPCPAGDLLDGLAPRERKGARLPATLLDGASWDAAAILRSPVETLTFDLGQGREVNALLLQGDNNDSYLVEASEDGGSWRPLWEAGPVERPGLRTRAGRLSRPARVRYLRVAARGGDGLYSVGRVQAFCRVPEPWPPRLAEVPVTRPVPTSLGQAEVDLIKGLCALLGLGLCLWAVAVARAGRPQADGRLRLRLLVGAGLLAGLCWPNLFRFHFSDYPHVWEQLHYFVGARYAPELGYTRLYECIAVADIEKGLEKQVRARRLRDLRTNRIIPVSRSPVSAGPGACKRFFSTERWQAFTRDLDYFRGRIGTSGWTDLQLDHGYNASPVWAAVGTRLAGLFAASDTSLVVLGLLDAALLLLMWAVVAWAFGWGPLAVALLWWGTNGLAHFGWNGGSFLRMDWLAASIIGVCLVKRGQMVAGGFAIGYAALLRLFPAVLLGGLLLKALLRMVRARRLTVAREHLRLALGVLLAVALLVPLSLTTPGASWSGFLANTRKHQATWATNHLGLQTVVSYQHATRGLISHDTSLDEPWSVWKEARARAFERRSWLFALLLCGFLVLLGRAVEKEEDWVTLVLSIGLIPFTTYLAGYYYSIFLGYGLLWRERREGIGAGLCLLAAFTVFVPTFWPWLDTRFTAASVAVLGFVVAVTARPRTWGSPDSPPSAASPASPC